MKVHILSSEDLNQLTHEEKECLRSFLKKDLWSCLEGKDPLGITSAEIFGFIAESGVTLPWILAGIAGIAIVSLQRSLKWARMQAFQIKDSSQYDEVGKLLLDAMMAFLRERSCFLVNYIYSKDDANVPQLEPFFNRNGWTSPQPIITRLHFDALTYEQSWSTLYRNKPLPKGMKIFSWKKLKPTERNFLLSRQAEGTFPIFVSPFYREETIEHLNSLGIRYKGEVVGWIITHRLDPDTICYTSIYMMPEFRNTEAPICLIAKAIELHKKSPVPKAIVEVNLAQVDQSWISFVKKRLLPVAIHVEQLCEIYYQWV